MKRDIRLGLVGAVLAMMLVLSGGSAVHAAIVLQNPSFETGDLTGWTFSGGGSYSVKTGSYSQGGTTFSAYEGSKFLLMTANPGQTAAVYQSVTANAGEIFTGAAGLFPSSSALGWVVTIWRDVRVFRTSK